MNLLEFFESEQSKILTAKLNDGTVVLGIEYKDKIVPKTFTNKTQAEKAKTATEASGVSASVYQSTMSKVFYVKVSKLTNVSESHSVRDVMKEFRSRPTKMTSEEKKQYQADLEKSRAMGKKGFEDGKHSAPVGNKEFINWYDTLKYNHYEKMKIMEAYSKAWNKANASSPWEEK